MSATAVRHPRAEPGGRLDWGSALSAAFTVTFVRPASWPYALAGFLARGGLVALLVPVLVIPTPTGMANSLGGPVSSFLFGTPSTALLALAVLIPIVILLLVIAGAVIAAWSERRGIADVLEVAVDEGYAPPEARLLRLRGSVGSVAVLRLLGYVPPAIALALSAPVLYDATYRELILPAELRTPLGLRILREVPGTVLTIGAVWLVADAAASLSVRRHALEGRRVPVAWLLGWFGLIRRPIRVMGTALATVALMILLVAPAMVAAALGWLRVRALLREDQDPTAIFLGVLLFVALWLGALVLAGIGSTFRGAAWTFEVARGAGPTAR